MFIPAHRPCVITKCKGCFILAVLLAVTMFRGAGYAASGDRQMDFSKDRFLLGNWECKLSLPDRTTGHETATYKLVLGDRWLYLEYTLTPPTGLPHSVQAYEAYDSSLRKWVYSAFTNSGNYGQAFSNGWQGTSKVYVPAPDDPRQFRLTVTKISDTEFTEKIELPVSQGRYKESSSLHCTKL